MKKTKSLKGKIVGEEPFLDKHYILKAFLLSFESYWFIFLSGFGIAIDFFYMKDKPTLASILISACVVVISLIIQIISGRSKHKIHSSISRDFEFQGKMLTFLSSLINEQGIYYDSKTKTINHMAIISSTMQEARNLISSLYDIDSRSIGFSIISNISGDWEFLQKLNVRGRLTAKEIMANEQSTAAYILQHRRETLMFPNKLKAQEKGMYVFDDADESEDYPGSIYCKSYFFDDQRKTKAIICVHTYGTQICENKDKKGKDVFTNIVMRPVVEKIEYEMGWLVQSVDLCYD